MINVAIKTCRDEKISQAQWERNKDLPINLTYIRNEVSATKIQVFFFVVLRSIWFITASTLIWLSLSKPLASCNSVFAYFELSSWLPVEIPEIEPIEREEEGLASVSDYTRRTQTKRRTCGGSTIVGNSENGYTDPYTYWSSNSNPVAEAQVRRRW